MDDFQRIIAPDVLEIKQVSKKFVIRYDNSFKERILQFGRASNREDFEALADISLTLQAGHTIGLIGHNGSGKSTLLKIIGGIVEPSEGQVLRRGKLAALLELGAGFHPDLTGRENVYMNAAILGMTREETDSKFDEIVDFSGIRSFIDTQVKYYSSGMYVRLGFAVAIHTDPDILLVDEVLAVGDEAFQRKCLDKITEFQRDGKTIVLVTHNLGQVVDMCDRAVLLDHGRIIIDGDPNEAVNEFRKLLERNSDTGVQTDSFEIVKKVILNGQDSADVKFGENLSIDIELAPVPEVPNLVCAVFITDSRGNPVFGTSVSNISETATMNPSFVSFKIQDIRFATGSYFVNVTIANGENHIHIEDAEKAGRFTVQSPTPTDGVVYMASEATFTRP